MIDIPKYFEKNFKKRENWRKASEIYAKKIVETIIHYSLKSNKLIEKDEIYDFYNYIC